jgi:hypothetical protein
LVACPTVLAACHGETIDESRRLRNKNAIPAISKSKERQISYVKEEKETVVRTSSRSWRTSHGKFRQALHIMKTAMRAMAIADSCSKVLEVLD